MCKGESIHDAQQADTTGIDPELYASFKVEQEELKERFKLRTDGAWNFLDDVDTGVESIADSELRDVGRQFHEGIKDCGLFFGLPESVQRLCRMEYDVQSNLALHRHHQAEKGLPPDEDEMLAIVKSTMLKWSEQRQATPENLELLRQWEHMMEDERLQRAHSKLNGAVIKEAWMCFELLAQRVWIALVNRQPMELGKNLHRHLPEDKRINWDDLARVHFDLSSHIGSVLASKLSFQSYSAIRSAYNQAIPEANLSKIIPSLLVLVERICDQLTHNDGRVTEDFLKMFRNRLPILKDAEPDTKLELHTRDVRIILQVIVRSGCALLKFADDLCNRWQPRTSDDASCQANAELLSDETREDHTATMESDSPA